MRRLDRYVSTELIAPFLFGVAAFMAVMLGIGAFYEMLKLIFRKGFPVIAALQVFGLSLPATVVMTLPMATMFASLTAMSRLSGDGELVALRASGLSLARIGVPVMLMGAVVSMASLGINEVVVPPFNDRAFHIMRDAYGTAAGGDDMALEVRDDEGKLERWLHGESFDPETMSLENATIVDFTRGGVDLFTAERVYWQEETWVLENAEHTHFRHGESTWGVSERTAVDVGRSADEMLRVSKHPEEMSLAELAEQAKVEEQRGDNARAGRLLQHSQVRRAVPWSSLGFALLGLSLGVRRMRASRGIGMGVSIAVIFTYYIVMNTLSVLGERPMANHLLIAWIPNVLLYLVGIGLLMRDSH